MADVSENHKYVKNRVYIRYPLETIQYSTCYICDSFSDHPQNDFKTATVIKRLESISGKDIHFWYGTKESFVAKPQIRHLRAIHPDTKIEIFNGMNHGQLLIDHPEEVADRITRILYEQKLIDTSID